MKQLTLAPTSFSAMLSDLIASGVTFEAEEDKNGDIVITFTGRY